ncbi:hypothetical protein J2W88_003967 [Acidovorax delafieldii]|uniref:Uncharacterized protein n=1 Tax=Acidovorax delafieldii TaxID=47920 RepID=A0AAJ2F623_ACIDE|nr:hypothetical protein [Acidovorax delafieldii]MDR6768663.1 hypothetical protein [Acidovorax delafieldii]MDR6837379.1 hypothetical protein [Acidovorax delafieldii]MDR7366869.1 hypothetical protein [Acidovorax delafieldii]
MTNPTPPGQAPEIQRYKIGYTSDEWDMRSSTPGAIRDAAGKWVRYEDHAAAIATLRTQQPVAQQGAADGFFLLLPQRPKPEAPAGTTGLDWDAYSGAQMLAFGRDCSDAAIAALRTQQPAPAGATDLWAALVEQSRTAMGIDDPVLIAREDLERMLSEYRKHATPQPAPATQQAGADNHPYAIQWDAELGRTAMRFVDRAGDVHPDIDDAETICTEFHAAMSAVIERMPHVQRMSAPQPSPTAQAAGDEGKALAALRYYKHECSGAEPSISVFHRMVDEALEVDGKAQAAESVPAVDYPPLPQGWPARFRCDSCDGNGEVGDPISMGHFQPPERARCPDCDGRGWGSEGAAFSTADMRAYVDADRAARAARAPAESVGRDAERLDFLIEQRAYVVSDPDACPGYWLHFIHKETGGCWVQGDEHPTPRAAIDAAMAANGGNK